MHGTLVVCYCQTCEKVLLDVSFREAVILCKWCLLSSAESTCSTPATPSTSPRGTPPSTPMYCSTLTSKTLRSKVKKTFSDKKEDTWEKFSIFNMTRLSIVRFFKSSTSFELEMSDPRYKEDFNPISSNCNCYTCLNHTRDIEKRIGGIFIRYQRQSSIFPPAVNPVYIHLWAQSLNIASARPAETMPASHVFDVTNSNSTLLYRLIYHECTEGGYLRRDLPLIDPLFSSFEETRLNLGRFMTIPPIHDLAQQ